MRICVKCGTNQVQRIRDSAWRTLCKCRICGFKHYDTLSWKEYDTIQFIKQFFRGLQ